MKEEEEEEVLPTSWVNTYYGSKVGITKTITIGAFSKSAQDTLNIKNSLKCSNFTKNAYNRN